MDLPIFWRYALIVVCSYLLGSLSFAIIVCKATMGRDIREYGSGNAGLTNAYRTMGGAKTLFVLFGDVAKGAVAIVIGNALCGPMGKLVAGIFVILGHVFPIYFGFRGGKGVLVGAVFMALIDWRMFAVAFALFLAAVLLTRWVSLGSILGAVSFPITMAIFYRDPIMVAITAVISLGVIFLHRANIARMLQGTENKFSVHKATPKSENTPKDEAKKEDAP